MKKYLFTQAKKSLSLIMAILMLMSCWVWVAPTEAEAANKENGEYHVRIVAKSNDDGEVTALSANVYYDGGSKAMTAYPNNLKDGGQASDYTLLAAEYNGLPSFPTKFDLSITIDKCNGHKNGTYFFRFEVYDNVNKTWVVINNDDGETLGWSDFNGTKSIDNAGSQTQIKADAMPKAESIGALSTSSVTLDVPKITDTATEKQSGPYEAKIYDQYGVWNKEYAKLLIANDDCSVTYDKDNYGLWLETSGNGAYIKVNQLAQQKIAGDAATNTATAKLYGYHDNIADKEELATVTLKYETYTIKVDQKLGATMTLSNGKTQDSAWSFSEIYGAEASTYPTSEPGEDGVTIGATKAGYTFKGYWTVEQPASGDASYNAETAAFASPVDETTFNSYKGKEGAIVSGNFVTLDGAKYYNAGKQWNADTDFTVTGDITYYGWWLSKDIPVKFYDIDGTYLGSKTAKLGSKPAASWYADPKEYYDAGAFEYNEFSGSWRDITGVVITEGSYTFGDLETLTLTPIYNKAVYSNTYQINFIDPSNGGLIDEAADNGIGSGIYNYRDILSGANVPTLKADDLTALKNDLAMSYEFEGWTTQKPASGYYHKVAVDDTSVAIDTDMVVRGDATYYAVYRGTVRDYLISFAYTDTKGEEQTIVQTVPYGATIKTPNEVNRTYASGGMGYVLEGWDYRSKSEGTLMLDVDEALILNAENVTMTAANLATAISEKPITFTAHYDDGTPTPYNVSFKYKNAKGEDVTITDSVYHGFKITQEIVDRVDVPYQYDDGEALYTFSGNWKVTEGVADKEIYTTDEFTSFGPTSNVTFEAIYGEGVPFYTVTYHNGAVTYSERVLSGTNVPAWLIDSYDENGNTIQKEYEPAGYADDKGEYTFVGWFDEEQADKTYNETNGTQYTTANIVEGNLDLYAQYDFEPYKFTIKFMNFDGTEVLESIELEAGKSYEETLKAAEAKAELRPADETNSYTFVGWDYKVPVNYLCEGKDVTYTAQYRPSYIYYEARWYNDLKSMTDADLELEILGQNGLLAITTQTYEGNVYAPAVELTPPTSDDASVTMVFDGWYYINKGIETAYQRGLKITNAMSFYAKYKEVKNAVTLTTVVGDASTDYEVEYGETASVGNPADGYVDATSHNNFIGWYTDESYKTAFDLNTAITADTTIYAKFDVSAHEKTLKELVTAPTYYEVGTEKIWCACDKEKTTQTVNIPMLADTKAPTGTIYLGTQGQWSSTDEVGAAATDNDEVKYYANADTDIILTINDTGDVNALYNPSGIGKGIQVIQGIISTGVFGADTTEIAGIQTLFSAEKEEDPKEFNNIENYVIRLGTYSGLEDGKTYIAYYYVKDKAGNVLNTKVRTAKFIYDTTAPEFSFEGESNFAKFEAGTVATVTYCGKATVTDIEEGATVTVNGTEVEYTGTTYDIVGKGNYIVKVTDKAGNSTVKKVAVADGHNEVKIPQAATCTVDGYEKVTCTVCDKVISNIVIKADGHKYSEVTTVLPTCTEEGYDIKVCSVCGDEVKTNTKPAAGHTHDGYTVVTAATCTSAGKKISNCTVCGKDTLTEKIPADPENGHVYGAVKVLKATCDKTGEEYQNCKYCFAKKTVKVIDKLNHVDTGRYTEITTAPTCHTEGVETEYCKACNEPMSTTPVAMVAHTLVLVKHDAESDQSKDYPGGYMQYECQVDGCTHTEGKTAIAVKATYTVTFKGAGVDGEDVVITKTEGESIAVGTVADQTKASDSYNDYTFAGWKGTDDKVVKLPFKVTKNETYTAEFTATKRVYTHTFLVEKDGKEFAKVIGAYYAPDKKPMAVPTKAPSEDGTKTYSFDKWVKVDPTIEGEDVYTMTGDATFYATYKTTVKTYDVIFYNGTDYEYGETVQAGGSVTYAGETPVKAPDNQYHYTFNGWLYNGSIYANGIENVTIENIKADTRIYASFEKTAHVYSELVSEQAATCTDAGKKVTKCSCHKEFVEDIPALGHDHSIVLENNAGIKCSRCDDTIAPEAKKVTLTFKDAYGKVIKSTQVVEGGEYTIEAPAKSLDAQYEYSFKDWTFNGAVVGTNVKITVTAGTEDATYIANYYEHIRSYYVTYVNWNYDTLQTQLVKYGQEIPAFTKAEPKRTHTDSQHFDFAGWEGLTTGMIVTGPTQFKAKYTAEDHNLNKDVIVEASCLTPYTTYKCCDHEGCDYREAKDTVGETLAHTPNADGYIENVAPSLGETGLKKFVCSMCGETITETIPEIPADEIIIIVYNNSGKLATHGSAHVTLFEIVDGKEIVYNATPFDTDANGSVKFTVVKGKTWRVAITGDDIKGGYGGSVKAGTNTFGSAGAETDKPVDDDCTCNCHKNTFWGIIFRFFQKLVMWLSGNPKCCGNPDPRIWG